MLAKITFAVDAVQPASQQLETTLLDVALVKIVGPSLAISEPTKTVVAGVTSHPLFAAVHLSFSEHRPLILSPDIIWTTIAQGFAQHINCSAESLRTRLVKHEGKLQLKIERDDLREGRWSSIIEAFTDRIREHVGPGLHRLLHNDFSTTGPIERTVSSVVMMDAFQRFFDYMMLCICGIPEITLLGTPQDWREIRRRLDVLVEYDLGWWVELLAPVCDELLATASGHPNQEFWQSIYKPQKAYGSNVITGWLARLFPYIEGATGLERNPSLTDNDHLQEARSLGPWISPPIYTKSIPAGLSRTPVLVTTPEGARSWLEFVGGFVGVSQEEVTGALSPVLGWVIREDPMQTVLETIHTKHRASPIGTEGDRYRDWSRKCPVDYVPGELLRLYQEMSGATLFDGVWTLHGPTTLLTVEGPGGGAYLHAVRFIDLSDGRCLLYVPAKQGEWWIVLVPLGVLTKTGQRAFVAEDKDTYLNESGKIHTEEIPLIAKGIEELFRKAFSLGPFFFDAPDFQPIGLLKNR